MRKIEANTFHVAAGGTGWVEEMQFYLGLKIKIPVFVEYNLTETAWPKQEMIDFLEKAGQDFITKFTPPQEGSQPHKD